MGMGQIPECSWGSAGEGGGGKHLGRGFTGSTVAYSNPAFGGWKPFSVGPSYVTLESSGSLGELVKEVTIFLWRCVRLGSSCCLSSLSRSGLFLCVPEPASR